MTLCSCCGHPTPAPIHTATLSHDRLVCSPLCAAIVQALTITNTKEPSCTPSKP